LRGLVPLVFPPRVNRIRYHGVFAPNARLRKLIVPQHEAAQSESAPLAQAGPS
jgi:hypothetical protein